MKILWRRKLRKNWDDRWRIPVGHREKKVTGSQDEAAQSNNQSTHRPQDSIASAEPTKSINQTTAAWIQRKSLLTILGGRSKAGSGQFRQLVYRRKMNRLLGILTCWRLKKMYNRIYKSVWDLCMIDWLIDWFVWYLYAIFAIIILYPVH